MKRNKKSIFFFITFWFLIACNYNTDQIDSSKNNVVTLNIDNEKYRYIKQYFVLSENREIERWYNLYLPKCKLFYKIENPTKDSILNLIKSYWITSNNQNHDILNIKQIDSKIHIEFLITMNYSYNIIASNTKKIINNLILQMIMDKDNKVISIKEISRA